jgi:hypothetical protein
MYLETAEKLQKTQFQQSYPPEADLSLTNSAVSFNQLIKERFEK